jgi:hypothetical protein
MIEGKTGLLAVELRKRVQTCNGGTGFTRSNAFFLSRPLLSFYTDDPQCIHSHHPICLGFFFFYSFFFNEEDGSVCFCVSKAFLVKFENFLFFY